MNFNNLPAPPLADRAFEEVDRVLADTAMKLRAFQGNFRIVVSSLRSEMQNEKDRHMMTCERFDQLYQEHRALLGQLRSDTDTRSITLFPPVCQYCTRPDAVEEINVDKSLENNWLYYNDDSDSSLAQLPIPMQSASLGGSPSTISEVFPLDNALDKNGKRNTTSGCL
jgi:hypothetical protein